jgi:hypothetical protein
VAIYWTTRVIHTTSPPIQRARTTSTHASLVGTARARRRAYVPPHCWCMHVRAGRPCIERRAVAFGGGFRTTATPRPRGAAGAAPAPALSRALRSRVYYWRQHACTAVVRTPMRAPTHPAAGSLDRPSLPAAAALRPAAASLLPRLATPSS